MLDETGLDNISRLQRYGFIVAWDDITSLSSACSSLARFRDGLIKLDRSMMLPENLERAGEIIRYCQHRQAQLIVEGVETQAQLAWLRERQVSMVQGYFFSPPVNRQDFVEKYLNAYA